MSAPADGVLRGARRPVPGTPWWALVSRQAARIPDTTALVTDEGSLTFRELDLWSDRLARLLREQGVRPGSVVACALSRSAPAVLAPLAVGKLGGVYAPLDSAQPAGRLRQILDDARPTVVLTDSPETPNPAVELPCGTWWRELRAYASPSPFPASRRVPADPVCLVYTSGSTGSPKGVLVGGHSLTNLYTELRARCFPLAGRGPRRRPVRVAHGMTFGFDAAWNPLLWLAGGHELHLLDDDVRRDAALYAEAVRERRLTVVEALPALTAAMTECGLLHAATRPDLILMGGEAISPALWTRLRAEEDLHALNLYGPTECTVFATSCATKESERPLIGRPIANCAAQVVDEELRRRPPGASGELLLGGACLALGYHDRPESDAESFTLDEGGERWYRTGDIVRRLSGGRLEFLGRSDDQVKIRGHRTEPAETEHALLAHPEVRQAAVRAERGPGGSVRLVAHVVRRPAADTPGGRDGFAALLLGQLRARLPDHLVPSAVVVLDALPLTAAGKTDRAALASSPTHSEGCPDPPLTAVEQQIATVWRSVLGIEHPGVHQDFFTLGGDSLLANAVSLQLHAVGLECSTREVMLHPTIAALATRIAERTGA
ncbi:amino acid adenylation domain-containing protein [Streptomyces sp. NPDC127068]|uniref:non-ribosomal peptide synthetase n=1 Tax=Streptomyces sp. NPDC127068 TaxID=3347127 RepID=UPI00365DC2ED